MNDVRFPLEPLLVGRTIGEVAEAAQIDRRSLYQWQDTGVPEYDADRLAVACGLHPASVWWDWPLRLQTCEECGQATSFRTCSRLCKSRLHGRREMERGRARRAARLAS